MKKALVIVLMLLGLVFSQTKTYTISEVSESQCDEISGKGKIDLEFENPSEIQLDAPIEFTLTLKNENGLHSINAECTMTPLDSDADEEQLSEDTLPESSESTESSESP